MKSLMYVGTAAGMLGQYRRGCGAPSSIIDNRVNDSIKNHISHAVFSKTVDPIAPSIRVTPLSAEMPFSRCLAMGRPCRMALSAYAENGDDGSNGRGHYGRKKSKKLDKPNSNVNKLIKRYPFDGYAKPLDRRWDAFWGEAVTLKPGQARRHIVMVGVLKRCIVAMREYAGKQGANADLKELYRKLVNEYYGISLKNDHSLSYLEAALFFALHNTKFNIFIGKSIGNSVHNDIGCEVSRTEGRLIDEIMESVTIVEMSDRVERWHNRYMRVRSDYKDLEYAQMRAETEKTILAILTPATDSLIPLPLVKKDLVERVRSISDSLFTDVSEAQHSDLRRWQNSVFIPLKKEFLEIKSYPNLDRYAEALFRFLRSEGEGADILNMNLNKLREFQSNPDLVKQFVQAVSEDSA